MFNFFANENERNGNLFYLRGDNFHHIKNVLRMKPGEKFLISFGGVSSLSALKYFGENEAVCEVLEENYSSNELETKIYLFQGLPKSDKLELITEKTVELGVFEIIPTEMKRSIVKFDNKKKEAVRSRLQKISESAAKQSKRNLIPAVSEVLSFKAALCKAKELDTILVPYENENGTKGTIGALAEIKKGSSVGVFIGPEGGFDESEIEVLKEAGAKIISLGRRILRTETAAITSVSLLMMNEELAFLTEEGGKPKA